MLPGEEFARRRAAVEALAAELEGRGWYTEGRGVQMWVCAPIGVTSWGAIAVGRASVPTSPRWTTWWPPPT
ncbi:hypothetical protein GCM10010411_94270 [Actinomadura fulvescens]|uniref:Uncharacterized protein n=1 Tax=Actinomadura fulvescens TaxID=46160 RepID=A0ABP6DGC0_9ACTN